MIEIVVHMRGEGIAGQRRGFHALVRLPFSHEMVNSLYRKTLEKVYRQ